MAIFDHSSMPYILMVMGWDDLIYFAITILIEMALRPKPKTENPVAANLDAVDAPVSQQGTPVPVTFGTVKLKSPNVVWYGDLRADPIYNGKSGKKG